MTDRRVKVTVDADYDPLIKGSGEAVVSVKAVQEEMKSLDKTVEETERDMGKLALAAAAAKKEVAGLGDKSVKAKADLAALDARIEASRKATQQLGLEFARTGEKVDGAAFSREKSVLARLERLRKELTAGGDSKGGGRGVLADAAGTPAEAEQAGRAIAKNVTTGMTGGFKDVPWGPILIGGLVEAVALALPLIGGMVAGAVAGSIGTAGIAGGILSASKDPVVKSAAAEFMNHIKTSFFGSGSEFVDPIRESLGILQKDFDKLELGKSFEKVAPLVTTIASGFGDLVTKTMPGLNKALDRMQPFAKAAAVGFGEIGNALGGLADDATKSHGALQGLELLFHVVSGAIAATGKIILWLSDRLQNMNEFIETFSRKMIILATELKLPHANLQKFVDELDAFNKGGDQYAADTANLLGDAFAGTAQDINGMSQALIDNQQHIDDWITKALGMGDANTAVAQDFADLNEKIKAGKKNWDDNTQAGRDNRTEIRRVIGDLEAQRQQAIATSDGSQASIDAINRKYNEMQDQLEAALIKLGATKQAIEAIAGKAWHITIITDILTAAAAAKQNKTDKSSRFAGFAAGGTTPAYAPFVVGEHGPEVLWDSKQHYVETKAMAQQSAQAWNGGSSSGGQVVVQNTIWLVDPMTGAVQRGAAIREASSRGVPQATIAAAYP